MFQLAESNEISFVLDNIEPNYEDNSDWDESDIVDRIDGGAVPSRVVAAYWRMRANATMLLVNTSEAGSSRGMDTVYPRMKALADEWDARATLVDVPPVVEAQSSGRLSSFPIRRV